MYIQVISKLYDIYFLPLKIWNVFKSLRHNNNRLISVRVIDKRTKNNGFIIKLQIINCRATYEAPLFNIISDYSFIESCDPISLIKLGHLSKLAENNRSHSLKVRVKNKNIFFNLLKLLKIKENNNHIDVKNYHYSFINIHSNKNRELKLLINKCNSFFDIPFNELILDKTILENIYPPDLLRIGYQVCQLDLQEDIMAY